MDSEPHPSHLHYCLSVMFGFDISSLGIKGFLVHSSRLWSITREKSGCGNLKQLVESIPSHEPEVMSDDASLCSVGFLFHSVLDLVLDMVLVRIQGALFTQLRKTPHSRFHRPV